MLVQAFADYFAVLNTQWQFNASYTSLILIEALLMVSWLGVETHYEVPKLLKFISGLVLLGTLSVIFAVSGLYLGWDRFELKGLFLSLIFLRCTLSAISPAVLQQRKVMTGVALLELRVRSKRKQQLLTLRHTSQCESLNDKQKEALQEIEQFKKDLIKRAQAKHLLDMAQIRARVVQLPSQSKGAHVEHQQLASH